MNEIMKDMSVAQKVVYIVATIILAVGTFVLIGWLADSGIETKYKLAIYAVVFGAIAAHILEMNQLRKKK